MEITNELLTNEQELSEIAHTRASFFAFLNIHFTTLPDVAFVQRIRGDEFTSVLDALSGDEALGTDVVAGAALMRGYIQSTQSMEPPQLSEALGVDRTRLYRGVSPQYGPPPPNEAVWVKSNSPVPEILLGIAEVYRQAGMAISPDAHERLDYIGVELDLHYHLACREADAWLSGDHARAQALLQQQVAFLGEHILRWVPAFIEKASSMAETDFYRGHLQMLRGFLTGEEQRLQELLADAAEM